jgi:hypothetical protein
VFNHSALEINLGEIKLDNSTPFINITSIKPTVIIDYSNVQDQNLSSILESGSWVKAQDIPSR